MFSDSACQSGLIEVPKCTSASESVAMLWDVVGECKR